jgi:hypothetical protein
MSSARIAPPEEGLHRLYPRHCRELVERPGRHLMRLGRGKEAAMPDSPWLRKAEMAAHR